MGQTGNDQNSAIAMTKTPIVINTSVILRPITAPAENNQDPISSKVAVRGWRAYRIES